jgi:hypothetical protein
MLLAANRFASTRVRRQPIRQQPTPAATRVAGTRSSLETDPESRTLKLVLNPNLKPKSQPNPNPNPKKTINPS